MRRNPARLSCVAESVRVGEVKENVGNGVVNCDGLKFLDKVKLCRERDLIPQNVLHVMEGWFYSYCKAIEKSMHVTTDPESYSEEIFDTLLRLVRQQVEDPYLFECYHEKIRAPFDLYEFGMRFATPLVDIWHSRVLGMANIQKAVEQVEAGENVVFVANHQSEGDPHAVDVLLNRVVGLDPEFGENIVFMAGDRVREDPLVAPFSAGRNLLTVYSKKHINDIPNLRGQKLKHNRKAINATRALFKEGGCCVWFAPSGGRDRRSADSGRVEVAPFNHDSLEMMRITARKSGKPVHFYTMSLATYAMLPPPESVGGATFGEPRTVTYAPMNMSVAPEVDWEALGPENVKDKEERSRKRALHLQNLIEQNYEKIGGYEQ